MERRVRKRKRFGVLPLALFLLVAAGVFIGVQYFTKTGLFFVPGEAYYDESLTDEEITVLEEIFTDEVVLGKDLRISAAEDTTRPELGVGEYLYEIRVPVADYYDERMDVAEFDEPEYLSIDELDNKKKLLKLNGEYYLDNYNSGAYFRTIKFDSEKFDDEVRPLVEGAFLKEWPDETNVLTFAQTGVTALSRGMNEKLMEVEGDAKYFSEGIAEYLRGFDLTHTSNESSFSDYATGDNICSDNRFIDTLTDIGLDIVELTGNHNQDCGDDAARNTIDIYNANNIRIVGGGKTAEEAAKPLEIDEKGTKVTMLAYNLSTGGVTLDDTPGANQYSEENAVQEIAAAKERGDFVIVDVQYYECSAYASEYEDNTCDFADSAAGDQVGFFRHLIDLGADVVVGTSAHQPQTYELYGNGVIYYGLGNLFFDQAWWPGTTRSLILAHYFYKGKLLQTKIVPTVYDENYQTRIMEEPEWFLTRLVRERPGV